MKRKQSFKKVQSFNDVLSEHFYFPRMVVIDVGCGTGDLVRWLTKQGAFVTGIDLTELIAKANKIKRVGDEKYQIGAAQELSFNDGYADLILYFASFHHVPEFEMQNAIDKCYNILKPEGHVVFLEPIAQKSSYYELTRLVEDEADIQKKAYECIKTARETMFQQEIESFYYTESTFQDFLNLIGIYVSNEYQKEKIIVQAKEIISQKNEPIESVKFRSLVRLNILSKMIYSI